MKGDVSVVFSDGSRLDGKYEITPTNFIVYESNNSPLWSSMFGLVGALVSEAVSKYEEAFNLPIADIKNIEIKKYKFDKRACFIETTSRETYIALFSRAQQANDYLQSLIPKNA